MSSRIRPLAIVAVAFGIVAAVVVALVVPTRSEGGKPVATAAAKRAIVVLPRRADKLIRGQLAFVPQGGTVHLTARMRDPLGGPPFVVRVFHAARWVTAGSPPSLKHGRLLGHDLCAQLGRTYRGQFGWLDAKRRFRPANFTYDDTPTVCGTRWRDERSDPHVQLTTLISDPEAGTARPLEAVAWGFGGNLVKRVALDGANVTPPRVAREGSFVASVPLGVRTNGLSARFAYRGRATQRMPFGFVAGTRSGDPTKRASVVQGTQQIEARAPDPSGGLPWGILRYRTSRGNYCVTQPGRIVGDRVGTVNFVLDTFDDIWDAGRQCGASLNGLPPDWPVGVGSEFGGGALPQSIDPTSDPSTGRKILRTLPGHTVMYGVARANVREVTLETPRDVRTIIPSPRAHSFIVVYDGTFPTGEIKLTATMADGSKKTIRETFF